MLKKKKINMKILYVLVIIFRIFLFGILVGVFVRVIDIVDVLFFLCVFSCWVFFLYVVFLIGVRAFFNFFGFIVLFLVWDWEGEGFLFRILGFWLFDIYLMMVLSWEDSGDWRWCFEETDIEFCILLRLFMLRGNFFFRRFS